MCMLVTMQILDGFLASIVENQHLLGVTLGYVQLLLPAIPWSEGKWNGFTSVHRNTDYGDETGYGFLMVFLRGTGS